MKWPWQRESLSERLSTEVFKLRDVDPPEVGLPCHCEACKSLPLHQRPRNLPCRVCTTNRIDCTVKNLGLNDHTTVKEKVEENASSKNLSAQEEWDLFYQVARAKSELLVAEIYADLRSRYERPPEKEKLRMFAVLTTLSKEEILEAIYRLHEEQDAGIQL